MAKRKGKNTNAVPVGKLSDEIADLLNDYVDEIADGTDEAAKKYAQQCRKDIKANAKAKFGGSGKYANGWSIKQTSKERGTAAYTVYNKYPGLPHLLENGHAKVNGGRVPGRTHIAPAEQDAVEGFQNEVEELISNAGG